MVNLRGILAILAANAIYFVLTDSASLNRLTLLPFHWWVGIVLVFILLLSLNDLRGAAYGEIPLIGVRFGFWFSIIAGILLALFPSGSTLSPFLLWSLLIVHFGIVGSYAYWLKDIPRSSKLVWSSYLVFLLAFSLLTVSAFFSFPTGVVILLFILGEISFLAGLFYMVYKVRDRRDWLLWSFLSGLGAFVFAWFATGNDVMFLVSNLIITRVIGSISLEGVVGGNFLYFLILVQFTVAFVLLVLMRRIDLLTLGLTGISFTFPPVVAIRALLFLNFMQGQTQELSGHQSPQKS